MKKVNNILLFFTCLILAACSGTRHLPKGEKLYVGAEVNLESAEEINKRVIQNAAESVVRPQPNKSYLGMRPKLWLYNAAGENPHSKLKKWLKEKGEAPVLIDQVKTGATSEIIDAKLFNMGIFHSSTTSEIVEKKHGSKVVYTSKVHKPFTIKSLIYDISDDSISDFVQAQKDQSVIEIGDNYNLDELKKERIRIDGLLKNKGYFYFKPDYLVFEADTSKTDRTVSFRLTLKDDIPPKALTVYRINNVIINQNYSLNEQSGVIYSDTIMVGDFVFQGDEASMQVKPKVITRSVFMQKGEVFSRLKHTTTLNRLMSIGYFKLVQINFSEPADSLSGLLDVTILLTPMAKFSFRAEIEMVTKSNNYTGPRMNLSIMNRNAYKGAELLNLTMAGTYEAQLGGNGNNLYNYSFNPQVELVIPRFLVPFNINNPNSIFLPKTHILFSYNFLRKISYFDMRTLEFVYGYRWKEDIRKEHELNPIDVSYSSLGNKSADFSELLDSNPFLKKSYEEQFIAGGNYSFTYNEQMLQGKKVHTFLQIKSEIAGSILSLANIIGGNQISSENPATVAGSVFSQYGKLSVESRLFFNHKNKNKTTMRFFAGVGIPFGNSSILPYSKQFFSGGPSSIRAFHFNSVGPGNYLQDTNDQSFLQMGGDIKLEMNAEYRFNIFSYLKGALFVDAGNVWLFNSNPALVGSPFSFSEFTNQLAIGTGLGLRIDVSFFVLRFDLATPLRKPWMDEDNRWVINNIDFGDKDWRQNNLVLNVAIGYPF